MLVAGAVARSMIVGRVHAPGRQVFTGNIGRDESTIAVRRHHTVRARLDQAHNYIGIVDRHVLVIDLRWICRSSSRFVARQGNWVNIASMVMEMLLCKNRLSRSYCIISDRLLSFAEEKDPGLLQCL